MMRPREASVLAAFARPCLLALALPFAATAVHAQTLDEVTLSVQGNDVVARIGFNATVQFLKQSPVSASRLLRIDFELLGAEESLVNQATVERRSASGLGGAPDLSVTYAAAPRARTKQITLQLGRAIAVKARQGSNARSIELVFVGAAPAETARPAAPVAERRFAVALQTVPASTPDKMRPVPREFQSYEVFSSNVVVDGVPSVQVGIGFFETEAQAARVLEQARAKFPEASVLDVVKRREDTLKAAAPTPAPAPATAPAEPATPAPPPVAEAPAAPAAPLSEADRRAGEMLDQARQAIVAKQYDAAIDLLNRLLLMPPNPSSKDAQELIGLAFERAGNASRARAEYQLYLKLFPEGEGAERVQQRLASLDGGPAPAPVAAAPADGSAPASAPPAPAAPPKTFSGSVAQYYYGGVARSQSLVNLTAGVDQQTLTKTTQSAVVTSADLNARFANPESETRFVLRGTGSTNLSSESKNRSLLGTAYVDYRRVESGIGLRAGRQSAISGGLLGLFDGVSMVYPVRQGLKVDVMGGVPANTLVSAPSQRLFAAMVEADGLFDQWGGNAYLLDQTSEGFNNRRAAGLEVRYSSDRWSAYTLLDYDVNFKVLNAVSVQASVQAPAQTTVTLLVDNRRAPSLQLTNALIANAGFGSLSALLAQPGYTLASARADALAVSAIARQGLISVSRPLNDKWQASADLRYSQVGALPAVGDFQATPATGAQIGFSAQLTGSNLYSQRDINNFSLSVTSTPLFKGAQIAYNNLTGLRGDDITLEPSIRLYAQHSSDGLKLIRVTPGMRVSYRVSRRASVLGESIVEHSTTDGPTGSDTTNSIFFYLGYRYEFN